MRRVVFSQVRRTFCRLLVSGRTTKCLQVFNSTVERFRIDKIKYIFDVKLELRLLCSEKWTQVKCEMRGQIALMA